MENLETIILVAGSLAVACAFGSTATCKLMLLVASGSKKINARGRPAISCIGHPLLAVPTAGHPAGFDDDIGVPRDVRRKAGLRVGSAVVIDLREWKYAAAARVRVENSRRPIAAARSRSPVARPARGPSVVRRP
jgi:hypothetical protein